MIGRIERQSFGEALLAANCISHFHRDFSTGNCGVTITFVQGPIKQSALCPGADLSCSRSILASCDSLDAAGEPKEASCRVSLMAGD